MSPRGTRIPVCVPAPIIAACAVALAALVLTGGVTESAGAATRCWKHSLQVVANLKADPPTARVVVFLGGSRARECTVSDRQWTRQLRRKSGRRVVAYNLGSSNQTFGEDRKLVRHLPTSTLVLIAVDEGRFTKPPTARAVRLPRPKKIRSYRQHRYSAARIRSTARKRALVRDWKRRRYPLFKRNVAANRRSLEKLVMACQKRGLRPVLVATPWNRAVIKRAFRTPRRIWRTACKKVAARHDIPFVDFSTAVRLKNREFYDLFHLVEPGRRKWQARLSRETAALLRKDQAMGATKSESAAFVQSDPRVLPALVAVLGLGVRMLVIWGRT